MNNLQMNPVTEGEYIITFQRFDENLDVENGASYHGYNILVNKNNDNFIVKKYDDEDYVYFVDSQDEQTILHVVNLIKNSLDVRGYKVYDQKVIYF